MTSPADTIREALEELPFRFQPTMAPALAALTELEQQLAACGRDGLPAEEDAVGSGPSVSRPQNLRACVTERDEHEARAVAAEAAKDKALQYAEKCVAEAEAAEADRDRLADTLREIAALPQPALQGGRQFFTQATALARAALDRHTNHTTTGGTP